ncbi:MAG TPA: retropepsin-like aspartic protease [Candidatus Elarobacter sp.]|nr:retropepsin-like aspartic protease [Candidatus Elarobacter sp.]
MERPVEPAARRDRRSARRLTRSLRIVPALALACCALLGGRASAAWQPPDLRPTKTPPASVLTAYRSAAGVPDARYAQRRERWTYVNGTRRLAVRVAVRDDDFRATIPVGDAQYAGGRSEGVRWRADANGIAHASLSDDQGDAIDRLPQSVFPFALADCALAGKSTRFGPAWVLVDRAPRDKPHWLYVDEASGAVTHEITREGARTIVTSFDRFEPLGTMRRPRHWRVSDGDAADDLDVTVDAIEPQALAELDVAIPQTRRTFAFASPPPSGAAQLPAQFRGRTIFVEVDVDGRRGWFVLDTGTASIMLDRHLAQRRGWETVLEHATVPRMSAGPLAMTGVSVFSLPLEVGYQLDGILGYDFFFGHVVHVDYEHERVEVLTPAAAQRVFADPKNAVIPAYVDEGAPLVSAAFGAAAGERFLLDSGSPHLYVLAPFARAHPEIASWARSTFGGDREFEEADYLEGAIRVGARTVPSFTLGPQRFTALRVGVQEPDDHPDALDIDLDGIVGTDQMKYFDWWFDYDGGRIAVRRNGLR